MKYYIRVAYRNKQEPIHTHTHREYKHILDKTHRKV